MTSESTSTFTGRNEFIKSPNSAPGDCLRRRFKNAAYKNSRRMPADKPIQIANMVLDIRLLSLLHANSNPVRIRGQWKLGLVTDTLVIPKMYQNRTGPQPPQTPLFMRFLRFPGSDLTVSRFGQNDGWNLLFFYDFVICRYICSQNLLPFGQLLVQ